MRRVFATAVSVVLLLSCDYTAPLTEHPTAAVNPALLGDWKVVAEKDESMSVRMFDENTYVITVKGDAYRAFHSDAAGLPLISVQNLNDSERKWLYVKWELSKDGHELRVQSVNSDLIVEGSREAMVKAIAASRDHPKLFNPLLTYRKISGIGPQD